MIALLSLCLVLLLIIAGRVGRFAVPMHASMCLGAMLVLLLGAISPQDALAAINFEVILFLLGMFVLSSALERSGLLEEAANRVLSGQKSGFGLMLAIIIFFAFGSALLVNDTMAVIAAPMLVYLSFRMKVDAKPLILASCFAITIGSMATPIGNPQNLLVALNGGMPDPFGAFFTYLLPPSLISLAALLGCTVLFWPRLSRAKLEGNGKICMIRDWGLAWLSAGAVLLFVLLLALGWSAFHWPLWMAALPPAILLLCASKRRIEIAEKVDWGMLLFFAAMFVLMQAVWDEGTFRALLDAGGASLASTGVILLVSAVLGQFISNVPLVAIYLPLLQKAGAGLGSYVALAGASTLGGNLTVMGAASNVILLEGARKRGVGISFAEFLKYGAVVSIISFAVLYAWLSMTLPGA
jgi:Na+/H+ antiporter NhaD/arsenite permease-like protein